MAEPPTRWLLPPVELVMAEASKRVVARAQTVIANEGGWHSRLAACIGAPMALRFSLPPFSSENKQNPRVAPLFESEHPVRRVLWDAQDLSLAAAQERLAQVLAAHDELEFEIAVEEDGTPNRWLWVCGAGRLAVHPVLDSLHPTEWVPTSGVWDSEFALVAGHKPSFPLRARDSATAALESAIDDYPIDVWVEKLADALRATTTRSLVAIVFNLERERFEVRIEADSVTARPLFAYVTDQADGGGRFAFVQRAGWADDRPVETYRAPIAASFEATEVWDETRPLTTGSPAERRSALSRFWRTTLDDAQRAILVAAARSPANAGASYEELRRSLYQRLAKEEWEPVDKLFRHGLEHESDLVARLIAELAYHRPALLERLRDDVVRAVGAGDERHAKRIKRCFKEALIPPDPTWLATLADDVRAKVAWRI